MNGRGSGYTTIGYASRQSIATTAGAEAITSEMVVVAVAAGHAVFASSALRRAMIDAAFTPAITATLAFTGLFADAQRRCFVC